VSAKLISNMMFYLKKYLVLFGTVGKCLAVAPKQVSHTLSLLWHIYLGCLMLQSQGWDLTGGV